MGMRFENGNEINMEMTIFHELQTESHVWVILKEDKALEEADPAMRGHLDWFKSRIATALVV